MYTQGAGMLCVENAQQNALLEELLIGQSTWLGYNQQTSGFNWPAGCTSTYTNWAAAEPNGAGAQAAILHSGTGGKWIDAPYTYADVFCGCQNFRQPSHQPTSQSSNQPSSTPTSRPTAVSNAETFAALLPPAHAPVAWWVATSAPRSLPWCASCPAPPRSWASLPQAGCWAGA